MVCPVSAARSGRPRTVASGSAVKASRALPIAEAYAGTREPAAWSKRRRWAKGDVRRTTTSAPSSTPRLTDFPVSTASCSSSGARPPGRAWPPPAGRGRPAGARARTARCEGPGAGSRRRTAPRPAGGSCWPRVRPDPRARSGAVCRGPARGPAGSPAPARPPACRCAVPRRPSRPTYRSPEPRSGPSAPPTRQRWRATLRARRGTRRSAWARSWGRRWPRTRSPAGGRRARTAGVAGRRPGRARHRHRPPPGRGRARPRRPCPCRPVRGPRDRWWTRSPEGRSSSPRCRPPARGPRPSLASRGRSPHRHRPGRRETRPARRRSRPARRTVSICWATAGGIR